MNGFPRRKARQCRIRRRAALVAICLLPALLMPEQLTLVSGSTWTQAEEVNIKLGVSVERQLAGGETHAFRVSVSAGQFVKVVVVQKGLDVVLKLYGPDGRKLSEVDGAGRDETVFAVAESAGEFRLEVQSAAKEAQAGAYEIRVDELREANDKDRVALNAERLLEEGNRLRDQRTAESRRSAILKYEEALPLWRAAGEKAGEANTLEGLGIIYSNLGEPRKAIEFYTQAVPLWRAVGDQINEANTLTDMGTAYWRSGEPQKALDCHVQAVRLARAGGDQRVEGLALGNTGTVYWSLGQPQEALKHYNQGLAIAQTRGDRRLQAITHNNIAVAFQQLGDLQSASESLTRSIAIKEALGDPLGAPLNNLGLLYTQLGDYRRALEFYQRALEIRRAAGERQGEATVLQGLSSTHLRLGELEPALKYAEQSLKLARAVEDRQLEAYVLVVIGKIHQLAGEPQKALAGLELSLSLRRAVGDRYGEAYALYSIGESYLELGDHPKATDYFRQSLELSRAIGDRLGEAATLYGMARTSGERGDNSSARAQIEEALAIIESTRAKVASQDFRSSFFASYQNYYELSVELLMRMHRAEPSAGYAAEALQAAERARARGLLETLAEARVDIREGVDAALLERSRSLQQQLNFKAERLTRLQSGKHTAEQETIAKREVESVLAEYKEVEAQIRAKSPRYAALTQPQPLSLKEIQQLLDGDTLLLEYALGRERSYLWAVTPTSINSYELPKRGEIEAAARKVYDTLVAKTDALHPEALADLSRMLLGPVAEQLGRKRLLVVGAGALQYVPFGALPAPAGKRAGTYEPLIVAREVVNLPSASVLAVMRRESARGAAPRKVAVLADPVFGKDDPRIKTSIRGEQTSSNGAERGSARLSLPSDVERSANDLSLTGFERLPVSRAEAELITKLVPERQSLKALDFTASRTTATGAELGRYQIVHFATHSLLNNQHPELSGIVLSLVDEKGEPQDGFLRLHEIYNLKLGADLVVLSACQTALGKEIRGEGLVGLTRGFMYAGAPRVVASLWKVSDSATAELMRRFYRNMLDEGMRPAAALRAAQVSLRKERQWAAPYYWAGFVIQGEWR